MIEKFKGVFIAACFEVLSIYKYKHSFYLSLRKTSGEVIVVSAAMFMVISHQSAFFHTRRAEITGCE